MSGVVTGDAVVLGLRPARLPSRALALAIDLAVVWAAYLLISIGLAIATASLDEAAVTAMSIATFVLVLVGAPIAVETLSHGRSLGKMACGLRVVRDDGGPIRFRHALVRGAMGVVEILMTFGVIACIASLVSARGRRIGDVFAGTLVVRERVPAARAVPVPPPPPWLVGRFAELDLSGVPDELWLAIRQYLTRMNQLDAEVSLSLAGRLADDLVARTGAPAPAGVPAAAYLAAVVNERQAREARRAFAAAGAARAGVSGAAMTSMPDGSAAAAHPASYPSPYPGAVAPYPGAVAPGAPNPAASTPYQAGHPVPTPATSHTPSSSSAGPASAGADTGRQTDGDAAPPATGFAPPA
ncbi:RDD family protein [Streptomyces sp. NPDC001514]